MPSKEKSKFSRFFKEDAETVQDIIYSGKRHDATNIVGSAKKEVLPRIKASKPADEDEMKTAWQQLRAFFRNANNDKGLKDDLAPALLSPLYTRKLVGSDFPIWVADENNEAGGPPCLSLKEILIDLLNSIGPEKEDAHILKENIERILHIANDFLNEAGPQLSRPAMNNILDELERQLDVSGDELHPFQNDLRKLRTVIPGDGVLLPYSANTSLQLLEAARVATLGRSRKSLWSDLKKLKGKLQDILRVEAEKDPDRKTSDKLHDSMDFADNMMDIDQLSTLIPDAGTEIMNRDRITRITSVLESLELADDLREHEAYLFIDEFLDGKKGINWSDLLGTTDISIYQKGSGCDQLAASFDANIQPWTELFRAKRIGELELSNQYQQDIHDEFFSHFSWQGFSKYELNNCPFFMLIADDVRLFDGEFSKLSNLLSANIPIKVIAVHRDHDEDKSETVKKGSAWHANTELGALMLSYKNIYIAQSTSITPKHLFNGFKEGLSAFAPAFFYLMDAVSEGDHGYLHTSASVESRDFPGFTYRGLLGTPWGSRFEVENNPQPNLPWPDHVLPVLNEKGKKVELSFQFTFADHAAQKQVYHRHFMPVEAAYWKDDLIPLTDFINNSIVRYEAADTTLSDMDADENIGKIPFIWMMDSANELHKVAVSWQMVLACQERLDFWRFLQENSGINNYHVSRAVAAAKADWQDEMVLNLKQIKAEHERAMNSMREEEASQVMENLTSVLLDMDTANVFTHPVSKPAVSATQKPDDAPIASAEDEGEVPDQSDQSEAEEIQLSNDPYIDTELCTACNECTEVNGAMFKYNADKLAYIDDPKAGTYSDLVEAAEMCPVSIIHPGSPLNPNEEGLEELIVRAEKFN